MGSNAIAFRPGRTQSAGAPRRHAPQVRGLLDDIRRLVRFLRVGSRESERTLGISGAQLFVLHELAHADGASLSELAGRTFTHQSSVSVVVSRLVERKLVSRAGDRVDARRVHITLTQKGRDLLQRAPEAPQLRLIAAIKRLTAVERRGLANGLCGLCRELDLASDSAPLFFEEDSVTAARGAKGHARG